MTNMFTNYTSPATFSYCAILVLLFFSITLEVAQAQYYDLRVGTERYYNEDGAGTNPILVAPNGIRISPIYLFERVIDEIIMNDTTWAVVEIDTYHSFLSPPNTTLTTTIRKDTVYQRMDESKLIQYNKGTYSVLMDFNLSVGDSIDIVLEDYTTNFKLSRIRDLGVRPIVFADTTIAFPNGPSRRIIFGDIKSWETYSYEYNMSVAEFINNMIDVGWNIPYPFHYEDSRYAVHVPFYFIEGAGVMFSVFSQREGLFMIGYKPIDAPMLGTFEDAPQVTSLEPTVELPSQLAIRNYPNPFNPSTTLEVKVPKTSEVQIHVYNAIGQQVTQLFDGTLTTGVHRVPFNAGSLNSGVYIVRVMQGNLIQSHRVLLLK